MFDFKAKLFILPIESVENSTSLSKHSNLQINQVMDLTNKITTSILKDLPSTNNTIYIITACSIFIVLFLMSIVTFYLKKKAHPIKSVQTNNSKEDFNQDPKNIDEVLVDLNTEIIDDFKRDNNFYKCTIFPFKSKSFDAFKKHNTGHMHQPYYFKCTYCYFFVKEKAHLISHQKLHNKASKNIISQKFILK